MKVLSTAASFFLPVFADGCGVPGARLSIDHYLVGAEISVGIDWED